MNDTPFKIDAKERDYLFIETSQIPNSGKGLYTSIPILKDEVISVFRGEILTERQSEIRVAKGVDRYFIGMPDGSIMDSMHSKCFAKYANDCEGLEKTEFKVNSRIMIDEDDNVCLIASRNIKAGAEVFCSYGKRYWKKHKH